MTTFHAIVGGNLKNTCRSRFFQSPKSNDLISIRSFLKKTRDNLTSTSVKVVPQTLTNMYKKFQQKILPSAWATAQKLATVRAASHEHFCVFSVIRWQLGQYLSYNDEFERKLKPVISSIFL